MLLLIADPAPPRPIGGGWITTDDYPAEARRYDRQGTVAFTLAIDAGGRVTDCTITGASGAASLDSATCRLARTRARFTPAKNAAGRAVAGTFSSRVTWALPPKPLQPVAAWSHTSRAVIDGEGNLLSCTARGEGTVPEDSGDFCEFAAKTRGFALEARGGRGSSNATVYVETRQTLDGQALTPARHEQPGMLLVSLISARLDIAETGLVENCTITERRGFLANSQLCDRVLGPFAPNRDATGRPRRSSAVATFAYSKQAAPTRR